MPADIETKAVNLHRQMGADFTLYQLQQHTGISRATLYRRIGSKETLLANLSARGLIDYDRETDIEKRIYAATRNVVAERGFIACTMEQIAKEAALGVATLYRHFGDKENLLRSFIGQMKPFAGLQPIVFDENADVEDDLMRIIAISLNFLNDNRDLVKILYSWQSAERAYLADIKALSNSTFEQIARFVASHQKCGNLRGDIAPQDLALSLTGLLFQYSIFAPLHHQRCLDLERDAQTILKLFLQGACLRP